MSSWLGSETSEVIPFSSGIRAAKYVRMSTEHQRYSTENQSQVITQYASRRHIEIVRTYADEGKSGLRIEGRDGLKQLIEDVQNDASDFSTILVYDVSRWGRFQDADESAYYEYICKRAGISVQYCAEQFENDGSPVPEYLGCKDDDYTRSIGPKFLIGAVSRAMDPGCKFDNMLILEGPQGILKSSSLETLFGHEYFTDEISDFGSKDAAMQLQGVWCVEIAELSTFGRAAAERTKEFVSRRVDRIRPPYGRMLVKWPRTAVLVGTTNETAEYFRDDTGNRRFWPVLCSIIRKDELLRQRNQLWAEAVARFKKNERWWLEGDEIALATIEQEARHDEEPWLDVVRKYVDGLPRNEITNHEILTTGLSIAVSQINHSMKTRVGRCMRKLGWRLTFPKNEDGHTKRVWVKDAMNGRSKTP
jgi:predicted P-loop ATPase